MEIYVYVEVYENETGEYVDSVYANHTIYNGYSDWFTQDWTSWNDDYYDFNVYMYDEDYNFEDEFWIYDVYLSSDDGGGGNQTDDDNGVGHIGGIDNFDDDDYVNDYIGLVLEDGEYRGNAYFEIYDEDNNLVDSGNPNYYGMLFISSNLTEGWYTQDVYYEEDDAMLQTGPFYSYGNSTEFEVVNVDNIVIDDDEWEVYDDVGFNAHQGNFDSGVADVGIEIYKYNHSTEEWDYHAYVETNETGEAWLYNETCGEYEWFASTDDEKGYYVVWAHCDDDGNGGGGDEDYDERFYDWGYDVGPSDTITIGYDPDTDCDCDVDIVVYIDVFDNDTGDYIDNIYDEHTIYNDEMDWFEQDWTAYENGTYDFYVYIYDPEYEHVEDDFWIYDVYLSSDDGGNQTDDDNGIGHGGFIDDWENDGNVNDYIGFVRIDDYFKEDAYFEIYQDGELVDSGQAVNEIFVSEDLDEGWYEHVVYYEEDGPVLQNGPFYSYGDSSDFEIVNVDNIVIDDDEYTVYDDVGFFAHRGNTSEENGEEGVEIAVYVWNEDDETWYDHAYLVTNETGEAWLYNETCGEYEWEVYNDGIDEKGYYEVRIGCDDTGGGGDEDYDEWFSYWDYGVDPSDTITIGYDPDTECDCYVDIVVYIDVFDNNTGDYIDSIYDEHTIYNGEEDWFEQDWTSWNDATYDFYVYIYDQEYGHEEDDFWIYDVYLSSDDGDEDYNEWFSYWDYWGKNDENDENIWNELVVVYDPNTKCDCGVDIEVYIDIVDNETGDYIGSFYNEHTIHNEEMDWFEQDWTADYAGKYDFYVELYDPEYGHPEDNFKFSLIMSDEWFDDEWHEDDSMVMVDLYPGTNYDDEIYTFYDFNVERYNEDEDNWEWLESYSDDAWISGSNDNPQINFEWTADESGEYRFMVVMYDEYGNMEYIVDYEAWISINEAPIIGDLDHMDEIYEGQRVKYEVEVMVGDAVEIHWDMGDGTTYEGTELDLFHMYMDNGLYEITITVDDGTYITEKTFEIKVYNVAPRIDDVMFDNLGNEGDTISFNAIVSDVSPSDIVLVSWTFPDGSTVDSSFAQYVFTDDGQFVILVTAFDGDDTTTEQIMVTVENVAPIFTEFVMPSTGQEGEALDFNIAASDPGDDTIVFNIDFGDGTSPMITQDGNVTHKFAEGDTFTIKVCATDEDGGETCREQILPVSILEQLEDSGLPGFNLLAVISALGVISILRRRTH
jgi:hypothetical protein